MSALSSDSLEPVFVMEAAEDRPIDDPAIWWQAMSVMTSRWHECSGRLRNPRSQTKMRALLVVVSHTLRQDPAQVFLPEWNHEIRALAAYLSYQPFAVGIRLQRPFRRTQHPQTECLELFIHFRREDRIAISNEKAVEMIARYRFSKLLQGPRCRRVCGDVAVHDAPRPDFHQEEHMKSSEPSSNHQEKITGDDGRGMIPDEGAPAVRNGSARASSFGFRRPIGSYRTQRDMDSELHR